MDTATTAEILRLYGPLGLILATVLVWAYRRIGSGKIVLTSATAAELEARIVELTRERDAAREEERRAVRCEQHQRELCADAQAKLIRYLEGSQRVRLADVERTASGDEGGSHGR